MPQASRLQYMWLKTEAQNYEDRAALVAPAPISLVDSPGRITFTMWATQVGIDGTGTCGIYVLPEGTMEYNEDELLCKVETSDRGSDGFYSL